MTDKPRRLRITSTEPRANDARLFLLDPEDGERLGEVVSFEVPPVGPGDAIMAKVTVFGPKLDLVAEVDVTTQCRMCGQELPGKGDTDG